MDKELFMVVKESKYSQDYKLNKTMGCLTEPATSYDKSNRESKMNKTLYTETGNRKLSQLNKTL